jgi:hypothetical protein
LAKLKIWVPAFAGMEFREIARLSPGSVRKVND